MTLLAPFCRSLLALSYVTMAMQRDLEYFLKHTGKRRSCADERPLVLHLLGGTNKAGRPNIC